jgi:hypothetical protein
MIAWFVRQKNRDAQVHDPEEGNEMYWQLVNPQEAWTWWTFLEATRSGMTGQWSALPYEGAWADQPAWLIHDLTLIGEYHAMIEEQVKGSVTNDVRD